MKEDNSWLLVDGFDKREIAGNKEGLIKLKEAIDIALELGEANVNVLVEDTDLEIIILTNKYDYLDSNIEDTISLWDKVVGIALGIWFGILPFIAIVLILKLFLYPKECDPKIIYSPNPLHHSIKSECKPWL